AEVRIAQRRAERPQQSLGKMGGYGAGAGARSCQSERLLSVRHQRQRLHHSEWLSGWQAVQGCERARGRHDDPGLPHHVAGTAEIDLGRAQRFWPTAIDIARAPAQPTVALHKRGAAPRPAPEAAIPGVLPRSWASFVRSGMQFTKKWSCGRTSLRLA